MQKISTLITLVTCFLLMTISAAAQTTYTISANRTWNSNASQPIPTSCTNCTINIADNVTLTIEKNVTCQNCTFKGGILAMTDNTLTLQTSHSGITGFNNILFLVDGVGQVNGAAPIYLNNSTFTFSGTAKFSPQQILDLTASAINFYGNSYMVATGGPVNLRSNSVLRAGDGTLSSAAYLNFNGAALNEYDASVVIVANNNNYYFNWNSYYSAAANKYYSTYINTNNCGSGYPHACQMAYVYGPVSLTGNGKTAYNVLPVVISDFSAKLLSSRNVELSWTTQQESNSKYFSVEYSADGKAFKPVGTVKAKGNTATASSYTFTHTATEDGVLYYRLKMVDADNSFQYSTIRMVRTNLIKGVSIFPNPAHDYVNVSLAQATAAGTTVRLVNNAGQVIVERTIQGNTGNIVSLPVQQVGAGAYLVQVTAGGTTQSSVVVIAR